MITDKSTIKKMLEGCKSDIVYSVLTDMVDTENYQNGPNGAVASESKKRNSSKVTENPGERQKYKTKEKKPVST